MPKEKLYNISEIFRKGMIRTYKGTPIKDRSGVARVVKRLDYKIVVTKNGPSKCVPYSEIQKENNRRKKIMLNKNA